MLLRFVSLNDRSNRHKLSSPSHSPPLLLLVPLLLLILLLFLLLLLILQADTPMDKLEACVRSVAMDGLLWGKSKLVDVAFGVKKLQINAVIEDEKVSTDDMQDQIEAFEDFVQSMDVVAFQKI